MVTDPSGAALAGANVRLLDENNSVIAQTTTESNGQYTFSGVSVGNYRLEVERQGFQKNMISGHQRHAGAGRINSILNCGWDRVQKL